MYRTKQYSMVSQSLWYGTSFIFLIFFFILLYFILFYHTTSFHLFILKLIFFSLFLIIIFFLCRNMSAPSEGRQVAVIGNYCSSITIYIFFYLKDYFIDSIIFPFSFCIFVFVCFFLSSMKPFLLCLLLSIILFILFSFCVSLCFFLYTCIIYVF